MKPEAQRITIAKFIGWMVVPAEDGEGKCTKLISPLGDCGTSDNFNGPNVTIEMIPQQLPDYLNDLNAMHEAEKVLTNDQMDDYAQQVYSIVARDGVRMTYEIAAPAAQRAEAFLRTLGLWKD